MQLIKRALVPILLITLFALVVNNLVLSETRKEFNLRLLAGEWQGDGEILIPKTSIPISIEGKAVFSYDSVTQRLRTSLEASRFFFTYADSGYLSLDTTTDSIRWEVWDGFGKHCLYTGKLENNVITGAQDREGWTDRIVIDVITDDSLSFNLTSIYKNGKSRKRASIDLWRLKP